MRSVLELLAVAGIAPPDAIVRGPGGVTLKWTEERVAAVFELPDEPPVVDPLEALCSPWGLAWTRPPDRPEAA